MPSAYVRLPRWGRDNRPIKFRADHVNHWLRLRHNFPAPGLEDRLRLELGVDLDLKDSKTNPVPWASFIYAIHEGFLANGAVEVTPYWATYNRTYDLLDGKLPLSAKLGACYDGTPHVEVDIGNKYVIAVAALGMLVAGKPINIRRKEVGGWRLALRLPGSGPELTSRVSLEPVVEVDAALQRVGDCLEVSVGQLSGVLRTVAR